VDKAQLKYDLILYKQAQKARLPRGKIHDKRIYSIPSKRKVFLFRKIANTELIAALENEKDYCLFGTSTL